MFGDPIKNEKRWAQLTLNSVCDGIGDGLHGTPEYDDSGDFYFINGNNLINGEIVITPSTKKVNEEVFKKYYRNISSNALLLSINGTLGKIAFYNNEAITLGKSACYINLKTFVNKYFVFELMKTDHFLKYLEENSTKSTIKNVSLKTIRNFQLISPPENLQNDFISFSKKIDKSKFNVFQDQTAAQVKVIVVYIIFVNSKGSLLMFLTLKRSIAIERIFLTDIFSLRSSVS